VSASDNPLLDPGLPDFRAIRPEHAEPAVDRLLADYRALLDEIEAGDEAGGVATLVREIRADDALALAWSTVGHLHGGRAGELEQRQKQHCKAPHVPSVGLSGHLVTIEK